MAKKLSLKNTPILIQAEQKSLAGFLSHRETKLHLLAGLVIWLVCFLLLIATYPDPVITGDSGSYVVSSEFFHLNGFRPIGYSWLLGGINGLWPSLHFTVFVHAFLYLLTGLFLLLTLRYFYSLPGGWMGWLPDAFLWLAPSVWFTHTMIMSDSFFLSLTLAYTGFLIVLINRFSILSAVGFTLAFFLIINTRYIGLVYLIPAIIALVFAHRWKSILILVPLVTVLVVSIQMTETAMEERFRIRTYSEFGNWAKANNAVSVIPYIRQDSLPGILPALIPLHQFILAKPDSFYNKTSVMTTQFIWNPAHAGKTVMDFIQKNHPIKNYTYTWLFTGKILGLYADYLIWNHPGLFFRHYLWPNILNVFWPGVVEGGFSNPSAQVKKIREVYGVDTRTFSVNMDWYGQLIRPIVPVVSLITWSLLIFSLIYLVKIRFQVPAHQFPWLLMLTLAGFTIIYLGGSIWGHPFHYRYQLPLHAVQLAWLVLILHVTEMQKSIQ
ncbi:MAG: hypothetical protein HUU10_11940 [Bacteroidetes bacterium]|nr:hypothetical protein [Bacteroidota bacterium]